MMKCYGYVLALTFLLLCVPAYAQIIAVPDQAPTIQNAINQAMDGDTVLVARGTYVENINFRGKHIVVASHFALSRDPLDIAATIIDGSQPVHPDTGSVVLFISGEERNAILEGFTITHGSGTRWRDEHGGGFFTEGGGILVAVSSPTIRHNIIINNRATRLGETISGAGGGGMRCGDGSPLITNNVIASNLSMYGGGLTFNFGAPVLRNNIIYDNRVVGDPNFGGGGLAFYNPGTEVAIIENNTIVNNKASGSEAGGGISDRGGALMLWNTNVRLRNNIIWDNMQGAGRQIFSNGAHDITYNLVEDGWTGGSNNTTVDPLFADMSFALSDTSPAIDAGDPDAQYNDAASPSGNGAFPSQGSTRNDMGAYGGPGAHVFPPPFFTSTRSEAQDALHLPHRFGLEQNYPNPFNPSIRITFTLPQTTHVRLTIFDGLGRELEVLQNAIALPGQHTVVWNASPYPAGVYYYRLQTQHDVETKTMTFLP